MCARGRERDAGRDVGIISGLLRDDQVGQENQGGSEGAHKAVRGRSSVKSLPPCHCDPPREEHWTSSEACVCV